MKDKIISLAKSNTLRQLVKYGIVGGIGFVIDFGVFWFLNNYLSIHYPFSPHISDLVDGRLTVNTVDTNICHIISSIIAITNNFILNSYFTFKVTDHKIKRFLSFFGIAAIGLVISTILLSFFIEVAGLNDLVAKLIAVVIVAMLQFIFNKFFTFK